MFASVSISDAGERTALLRPSSPEQRYRWDEHEEEAINHPPCKNASDEKARRRHERIFLALSVAHLLVALGILSLLVFLLSIAANPPYTWPTTRLGCERARVVNLVSSGTIKEGLFKCRKMRGPQPGPSNGSARRDRNPRVMFGSYRPILIRNANVWDGDYGVQEKVDVLLRDGLVAEIRPSINPPESAEIVDADGRIVTPGLVDMHSHVGLDNWPTLEATADTNERSGAALPFLRSLDAFNQDDPAIRIVASGGVTTSLVLPGSSNVMGGEAFAFKMRVPESNSAEDMLLNAGLDVEVDGETGWRWMKMSCGENPKNAYGKRGFMPTSRMGSAFIFREHLTKARELIRRQNDWCTAAEFSNSKDEPGILEPFPEDIEYESLVALLRGAVKLNVHCYTPNDLEMMVRMTREIPGFVISAFHHALEAYLVVPVLKRLPNNATIAMFADHWGYKHEAFSPSVYAPKIVHDAGLPVAIKSDHPVLNAQHLIYEAQKTHHYGMSAQAALASVTSVPAKAMGVGHRIGKLAPGYDADVIIWERHPLRLGTYPLQVFVDGIPLIKRQKQDQAIPIAERSTPPPSAAAFEQKMKVSGRASCTERSRNYVVMNIGMLVTGDPGATVNSTGLSSIVVEDGIITCAGKECKGERRDDGFDVYDIDGGWVVPGTIALSQFMGLVEIPAESAASDGNRPTTADSNKFTYAVDGLRLDYGKHLEAAFLGGVTIGVVAPQSRHGFISGWMVAYRTGSLTILDDPPAIVKDVVGLLVQIGDDAKEDISSISAQIAALHDLLQQATNATTTLSSSRHFAALGRGEIPLVVRTHSADFMAQLILLKRTHPNVRIVILGGAEAYIVAHRLREVDIPVVLNPPRCTPGTWESLRCLSGPSLVERSGIDILLEKGVDVGLTVEDDGFARNLLWEAGWAQNEVRHGRLSDAEAIALVTSNLAAILGLDRPPVADHHRDSNRHHRQYHHTPGRIQVKALADFVAFDSRPLEFGAAVQLIAGGGKRGVFCWPAQTGIPVH